MKKLLASCLALCLMIVISGCKASSDSQEATTAIGGMMPAGESTPEIMYAVDQAEVKVLAERTISKESLSTFREKLEEKRAAEAAMQSPSATTAEAGEDATTSSAPEEKSIWGSVRSLLGGKKPAAKTAATAEDASTKDDSDAAPANENDNDSADTNDDAGNDDDW